MCSVKRRDAEPEDCDACGKRSATRVRAYSLPPPLSEGSPFVPIECYELQCWSCGRRGKITRYVFVEPSEPSRRRRR